MHFQTFICILCLISPLFATLTTNSFVADYHYTYIEVTIEHPPEEYRSFYIELAPLPIYKAVIYDQALGFCPEYRLSETYFGKKKPTNKLIINVPHLVLYKKLFVVHIFTSLYGFEPTDSYELRITGITPHDIADLFYIHEQLPSKINLVFFSSRIVPKTRQEGKKIHPAYNEYDIYVPHNKGLAFYRDETPPTTINIVTLPRSGTHLISETLQEILKEHIITIPQPPTRIFDAPLKRPFIHARMQVSHYTFPEWLSSRLVLTYRSPITEIDSFFHSTMNRIDRCKETHRLKPGYEKIPKYKDWVMNQVNLIVGFQNEYMNTPVTRYYVKFEEMQANPEFVFCEMLSFINGFPCEFSIKDDVQKVLKEKGMLSYYTTSKEKKESASEEELMGRYGTELVWMIYRERQLHEYMIFFGYINKYERFLMEELTEVPDVLGYKITNKKVLEEVLMYKHKYQIKMDHIEIESYDQSPMIGKTICEDPAFYPLRNCK